MKAALYARVSTHREEQKNSLHNQDLIAQKLATDMGMTIERKYIESVSGRGLKNRKAIQELLKDARNGVFEVLIVKSVSRLSRDLVKSKEIANQLERLGVRLIMPEDHYDSDDSDNTFNFNLMALFAEHESVKMSEKIKLGIRASAREGNFTGSVAPFGYRLIEKSKRLEIDEETGPFVQEIFNLYLYNGWGMSKIGNYLMENNIKAPGGGKRWHQNTVSGILKNPHYTGMLVQHRTSTSKFLAESESYRLRNSVEENNQVSIENAHPPLISHKQFQEVQNLIESKKQNRSNGKESLFAHIAFCADCGIGMNYKADRRKKGAYVCGGYVKHTKKFCSSHIIEEAKLIETISQDVSSMVEGQHNRNAFYDLAKMKASALQTTINQQITILDKEYKSLDDDFEYYVSLHKKDLCTDVQLLNKNTDIQTQQSEILERKMELEREKEQKKDMEANIHAFERIIDRFLKLDIRDKDILKSVLRQLIDKILVYENQEIVIHYKFLP